MNIINIAALFVLGLIFSGCSYSKENLGSNNTSSNGISKDNVVICRDNSISIDFCTMDKINLYNKRIIEKANFSKNKLILIIEQNRDVGKGEIRKINSVVAIDLDSKVVIPLPQVVGNFVDERLDVIEEERPTIKFSKENDTVCLSGTTYSINDNNINVENQCYRLSGRVFLKVENQVLKPSVKIKQEYSSDNHFKCLNNFKLSICKSIHIVASDKLVEKFSFVNSNDGDGVVIDFNDSDHFLIISPFQDDSGRSLRIMEVKQNSLIKEKFVSANKNVEIDENLQMTYYEGGKKIKISLR